MASPILVQEIIAHGMSATEGQRLPNPDVEKIKSSNVFNKAIVIDVIPDPSVRKKEEIPKSLNATDALNFFSAPRNSLICRLLSTGNSSDTSDIVCYPFFSSHFCLPVKPGEQVWLIKQEFFSSAERSVNYWISRVSEQLALEDANFTAFTRETEHFLTGALPPDRILDIPNDGLGIDSKTISGNSDAIVQLITGSLFASSIVHEPVPRLTKRPGDLVLQGSNNSAIVLGIDRGFGLDNRPSQPKNSNANDSAGKNSGTIDIVAGRGRYFDSDENEVKFSRNKDQSLGFKNSTQPFIAKNVLEKFETDKDPVMAQDSEVPGNSLTNPAEGDPDFLVDASRVYVSENSDIDRKLGLDVIKPKQFENDLQPQVGPTVSVKSDHIRIVARKVPNSFVGGKLPSKFEDVGSNGTIRIVKEGDKDKDLACIVIESDGTVHISGSKIFIGRASGEDGGKGDGKGPGNSQPYVKYQQLENLWNSTMDAMNNFCDKLLTHTTPGYGSPSIQINSAAQELKSKLTDLKKNIETVKSERIFGE